MYANFEGCWGHVNSKIGTNVVGRGDLQVWMLQADPFRIIQYFPLD